MRITKVKGKNYKINKFSDELTGRDIFVGESGSGKSTRLEAVMMAAIGYNPQLGVQNNKTMKASHDGARSMSVEIELDTGQEIKRMYRRKKKGCSQEMLIDDEDVDEEEFSKSISMDVQTLDIGEFNSMTDAQRKAFITNICAPHVKQGVIVKVIKKLLDDSTLYDDDMSINDNIKSIEKHYKEKKALDKKELAIKKAGLASITINPEAEDEEDIKSKIDSVRSDLIGLEREHSALEANKKTHESLESQRLDKEVDMHMKMLSLEDIPDDKESLKRTMHLVESKEKTEEDLKGFIASLEKEEEKLESMSQEYHASVADLAHIQKVKSAFTDGSMCPFINKKCHDSDILDSYINGDDEAKAIETMESLKELGKESKDLVRSIKEDVASCNDGLRTIESEASKENDLLRANGLLRASLSEEIPAIESKMAAIDKEMSSVPIVDSEAVEKLLVQNRENLSDLEKRIEAANTERDKIVRSESLKIEIIDLEKGIGEIDPILEGLGKNGVRKQIMEMIHEPLEKDLNSILEPLNFNAKVDIGEDKGEIEICLAKNGSEHPIPMNSLSGAQKVILASAFLCSIQRLKGSDIKVLLIEADSVSNEMFEELLSVLEKTASDIDNIIIARWNDDFKCSKKWKVNRL